MPPATSSDPAAPLSPAARPDNLTSVVFAAIRDKIVDASLPPGSSVSEAGLAAQLQVSKTPVREALLQLRYIGLVEPTTRGLRVAQPSAVAIRDAFEYRAGIEAIAGSYAAMRSKAAQHERILEFANASLRSAKDGRSAEFLASDRKFHLAVASATGNQVLSQAVENACVLTQALRQRDIHVDRDFVPDAREHVGIAKAIKAGDADLASERSAGHIQRIMVQLLDAFPDAAGATSGDGVASPARKSTGRGRKRTA
ncbi:GntR family transcriptional regulator [Amycolatopsis sp. GM8]|uniref:GntR family transcriptional regulator n=1 Tax=Amycolatopsis sp. GM8 TaxID=2896530 RepID=UPI001F369728|nr:GntR family transcriptional regulator [Amycolatopsis sp. GM8]